MIVKKIQSDQTKAKAASIRDLTDYIRAPQTVNPQEKVLYAGGRGFLCVGHKSQQAEMIALASEAVRSKNPMTHFILSWREGEQPSPEQVEDIVRIFLNELGLNDHQVIFGLHQDTDNIHLHLAVNRVHPDTLKVEEVNKGFDLEAAHQAIARIEHVQGWQRERNGRYLVLDNGELGREHMDLDMPRQPGQRKRDMENRTGEKSAERIAIEQAAPLIRAAKSWSELHQALAGKGMRYEKTERGAVVFVNDVGVKAGSADRQASLPQVQKRLGPYEPALPGQQAAARTPEPIRDDMPGWQRYIAGRKAHHADKEAALRVQRQQQQADRKALSVLHQAIRQDVLGGSWTGRGDALNALRSVLAAGQAADKAALQARHSTAQEEVRRRFRPYPDLEQWHRNHEHPELAEQWRHRASEPQRIEGMNDGKARGMQGGRDEPATPRDIRDYQGVIRGGQVHYFRKEDAGKGGQAAFVDLGKCIEVNDWRHADATLAAMQLSAHKWGSFKVTGNEDFKALCARLAAAHGFTISNPELQDRIVQERERIQRSLQQRAQEETAQPAPRAMASAPLEPLEQFERYAQAVDAQRYRVTSVRMKPDGGRMTFLLDKRAGVSKGFTPEEMRQRMPRMQRLSERGERIDYTPLSDRKHHLLIDAMSQAQLEKLLQDGYRPAVVLETSPERFQALITMHKSGTPNDEDVGRQLARRLNLEYGNPDLLGCIQPHPAPGFPAREATHRQEDGIFWEVRLLQAERCECAMTLALALRISAEDGEMAAQQGKEASKGASKGARKGARKEARKEAGPPGHTPQPDPALGLALASATAAALDAYWRHYQDVLSRHTGGRVNLSRVDSKIAVRLRVTGHERQAIEDALRLGAPAIRQTQESRDWLAYARRTVRFAHSTAGDSQAAELEVHRHEWEMLEGRKEVHKNEKGTEQSMQRSRDALKEIERLENLGRKSPKTGTHPKRIG